MDSLYLTNETTHTTKELNQEKEINHAINQDLKKGKY